MGGPGLQKFFLGLRASVWSKTKGGRAPGPLPWIRHCYWPRHSIHKNKQTPSPKICIAFVFHFSCVLQSSQEKLKTLERFRVKFTAIGKRQTRDSSWKCLKDEQVKTDLLQDRFYVGGKTRDIAIQLVLQQCCKTCCTFFLARFSVPLRTDLWNQGSCSLTSNFRSALSGGS